VESTAPTAPPGKDDGRQLRSEALRDLADMLEAIDRGKRGQGLDVFSHSTPLGQAMIVSFLAHECLGLAHVVFGDDLSAWLTGFRRAGNAICAQARQVA